MFSTNVMFFISSIDKGYQEGSKRWPHICTVYLIKRFISELESQWHDVGLMFGSCNSSDVDIV